MCEAMQEIREDFAHRYTVTRYFKKTVLLLPEAPLIHILNETLFIVHQVNNVSSACPLIDYSIYCRATQCKSSTVLTSTQYIKHNPKRRFKTK